MSTNFPTSLDTFTDPSGTSALTSPDHAGQHTNINDAVAALEAKVGANSSAVTTSLDYKISNLTSGTPATLANGFGSYPRAIITAAGAFAGSAGTMYLCGVMPPPLLLTTVAIYETAIGSANTAAFIGLYSLAANGNGTLVASTADFHAALTTGKVTKALQATYTPIAGVAYAIAVLIVGGSMPTFSAAPSIDTAVTNGQTAPFQYMVLGTQTTLPSTFTFASLSTTAHAPYVELYT